MSDAVFDGLSRFMRPVVNGEYASEMKTTLRDGMTQVEIEAAIRPPAPAMSDAWDFVGEITRPMINRMLAIARGRGITVPDDTARMSETSTAQINGGHVLALEDHVSVRANKGDVAVTGVMWHTIVAQFLPETPDPIKPEIPVTEEMISAAPAIGTFLHMNSAGYWPPKIYRAMAAVAPDRGGYGQARRELLDMSEIAIEQANRINALQKDRDFWKDFAAGNLDMLAEERHYREVERVLAMEITEAKNARIAELESMCAELSDKRMIAADDAGNHDYNGPVKDGKAVPDVAHERFHGAIGDVLAGKIITSARRQMQEALKQAPKDAPTTASTSRPMPDAATKLFGDPRRMGLA